MCGRKLRCGNHRCPAPCHTGPCRPCPLTLQVACACGAAAMQIPCGAESRALPPRCERPCPVARLCRHAGGWHSSLTAAPHDAPCVCQNAMHTWSDHQLACSDMRTAFLPQTSTGRTAATSASARPAGTPAPRRCLAATPAACPPATTPWRRPYPPTSHRRRPRAVRRGLRRSARRLPAALLLLRLPPSRLCCTPLRLWRALPVRSQCR
jgi:hypothetical protein